MKKSDSDKLLNLQKHLERTRSQLASPPERRKEQGETYKNWVRLEIKRTESKIAKLKD